MNFIPLEWMQANEVKFPKKKIENLLEEKIIFKKISNKHSLVIKCLPQIKYFIIIIIKNNSIS